MKRITHLLFLTLVSALALGGCGTEPTPNPTTAATMRIHLDWTPNTNNTGISVAQQNGWYAEQGIELQILPDSVANTPDTLLATGQAEFCISFEEAVFTDRVNGPPVKSVAAVL